MSTDTNVRDTSIDAYHELEKSGIVGHQSRQVMRALLDAGEDLTDRELSEKTSMRISSLTARRNKLVQDQLVELARKRLCRITHNMVCAWKLTEAGIVKYYTRKSKPSQSSTAEDLTKKGVEEYGVSEAVQQVH